MPLTKTTPHYATLSDKMELLTLSLAPNVSKVFYIITNGEKIGWSVVALPTNVRLAWKRFQSLQGKKSHEQKLLLLLALSWFSDKMMFLTLTQATIVIKLFSPLCRLSLCGMSWCPAMFLFHPLIELSMPRSFNQFRPGLHLTFLYKLW